MALIGLRYECQCCGRIARIMGEYDEDGEEGRETGYIYEFEGEQQTRWISTAAAAVRFRRVGDDGKTVEKLLKKATKGE